MSTQASFSSDELASAARYIAGLLRPTGIPFAMAYGTALGLVREGAPIEGDDDVDIFVSDQHWDCLVRFLARVAYVPRHPVSSCAPSSARAWLSVCSSQFGFLQLLVRVGGHGGGGGGGGGGAGDDDEGGAPVLVPVDFYAYEHFRADAVLVPWEGSLVPRDVLEPFQWVRFASGDELPMVRDPRGFCEAYYGSGWRTPSSSRGATPRVVRHGASHAARQYDREDRFPTWALVRAPAPSEPPSAPSSTPASPAPPPQAPVEIVSALYGFPPADLADVRQHVRATRHGGKVRVLNQTLGGGDPLPGQEKFLLLSVRTGRAAAVTNHAIREGGQWAAHAPCVTCLSAAPR